MRSVAYASLLLMLTASEIDAQSRQMIIGSDGIPREYIEPGTTGFSVRKDAGTGQRIGTIGPGAWNHKWLYDRSGLPVGSVEPGAVYDQQIVRDRFGRQQYIISNEFGERVIRDMRGRRIGAIKDQR
ncbi:hypothetical protein [Nitratireductor sp. GCM10026969]|uniref:hypothetical protein n=1 Tax=Nitratireductor sp. GCM10026969 TaxID=3252645 RepID=UPI00361E09FE